MKMIEKKKDLFTSKFGFIISCVGAALGLGNIWMFSYKLGKYGGFAFLIPYFIFVFGLGVVGLIIEFAFGRMHKSGSATGIKNTLKSLNLKKFSFIALFPPIALCGVFIFYSVVIGWIIKYFSMSMSGEILNIGSDFFNQFSGSNATIPFVIIAIAITMLIVSLGVSKGIEKLNKIVMPLLFVIFIGLAIFALTLPNAMEGVKYLVIPRFDQLLNPETWAMALGQAFFTVSLNGCGMVVYGAYIGDKINLRKSALSTALFDTIAAIIVSFAIIPAVFAFNLDITAGPALLFITVPKIFQQIPFGQILSILFFSSIIFAAITSSVNMLEGPVEATISNIPITRKKASFIISFLCGIGAIFLSVNLDFFNSFTDFVTIILSPLMVLLVSGIFLFGNSKKVVLDAVNLGSAVPLGNKFYFIAKYVFLVVTLLVIILGIFYKGIG